MPIEIESTKLYSTEELSEMLRLSEHTLRLYFRTGKLKGRKIARKWYVTEKDLKKFLQVEEV